MLAELEERIMGNYPKLFIGKDKSIIGCGNGWYWLINNLCYSIQNYVDNRNDSIRFQKAFRKEQYKKLKFYSKVWYWIKFNPNKSWAAKFRESEVEVIQVKEKLGSLRFYIYGGDDTIYGMIYFAEHLSWGICEECGSTNNITHTSGWIKTICEECETKKVTWDHTTY
jgi:hypothetical protein